MVDGLVASLEASDWGLPTPAERWSIHDQVSHLAFFDEQAVLAVASPTRFREGAQALIGAGMDFPDRIAEQYRSMPVPDLLEWFRASRAELLRVFGGLDGATRVPWFGPDMSLMSSATARLMETWAHGLDIAETIGAEVVASSRLHHIAHLGVRTLGFSFSLRNRQVPTGEVRVELEAPDGGTWVWGPPDVADTVRGTALDFCLVVTQRRHFLDTGLDVRGPAARSWMAIAQAFAGAASDGRPQRTVGAAS
ncbi:TIGR03084 family metal-binding protein [Nocardioides daeguensis]|uniref:TIGR03084 family metal-binding protein n=1 Tax=Nocardioides daeguensis TaxID=908359 RepID=A0ABP6UWD9_9ACTN